jgi:AraC-like DNA-binding protein
MGTFCCRLDGLPRIWFAHRYQTDRYSINFPSQEHALEVTYILEGTLRVSRPNMPDTLILPGSILVSPRVLPYTVSCPEHHVHETVGLQLSLSLAPQGQQSFLLPDILPPDAANEGILKILRRIIQVHALRPPCWEIEGSALALELIVALARTQQPDSRTKAALPPGYDRYTRQALAYIAQHLEERIAVNDIAASLKISPGHLSHLFKQTTGSTLVTTINRMKLSRMQELMTTRALPLYQAAASVGWEDESYASRLFKKHFGVSPTQYLRTSLVQLP